MEKDLGLVVIDEEQRFGVRHKEKLRQFRTEVDVLSMSATPIPRTLHMSMVGIRDISIKTINVKLVVDEVISKDISGIKVNAINKCDTCDPQAFDEASYSITVIVRGSQSVIDSLNEIGVQAKDIVDEHIMCQEVNDIVENYIYRNITIDSNINKIKEMFCTTERK